MSTTDTLFEPFVAVIAEQRRLERRATVERLMDAVEALRAEHPDVISREAFQNVVRLLDEEAAR